MSDAYILDQTGLALRQDVAARVRDFLERKFRGKGIDRTRAALETALRSVERAVASGLSLDAVRAKILAIRSWLAREKVAAIDDELDTELAELFEAIRAADRRTTIENWTAYVVTVDLEL
ncbi:MAG TPA: hypothetical protein VK116_14735, partial [Planctomycetota bacterium]|nr:hypothetical protein [Planctomycetota bacterium]